jgi:hypothetical protein
MAENFSDIMKELIRFMGEASAIIHYFSDLMAIISIYSAVFENSSVGAVVIWFVTALISAIIAELLKSRLPTPMRIVLQRIS